MARAPPPAIGRNPDIAPQLHQPAWRVRTALPDILEWWHWSGSYPLNRTMFLGLECSIKKERSTVRWDLSQVLERMEEMEQSLDRHAAAIRSLQTTTPNLTIAHRMALYKIEDQENRKRRNNIRIRGLPEATGDDDLLPSLRGIFNVLLGRTADHPLKIDRAHRDLRPRNLSSETLRDIICRVHYYEEKELIMRKAREKAPMDFDGETLLFFPDPARENWNVIGPCGP